ncbi:MAG TPA: cell envelope biogenesis protein TolA [Xanthobacteraceae bacterium]|nr:cell envelope biogenesis protein TolA [Xanthobacteraceae bacterium]
MSRKLKAYEASVGFFDLAVAAPSMKAALQAWGAERNLFHEGVARESKDPDVIATTMANPGVVLKRPVGSAARFREHAELPTYLAGSGAAKADRKSAVATNKHQQRSSEPSVNRKAALASEREQRRRERERAKHAAAERRQQHAVDEAQGALDAARRRHQRIDADIQAARKALEKKSQAEEARWEKERARLEAALRRAQGS